MTSDALRTSANEERSFPPSAEFVATANAGPEFYARPRRPSGVLGQRLESCSPGTGISPRPDWSNPPFAKWFADGQLNVAYNCGSTRRGRLR